MDDMTTDPRYVALRRGLDQLTIEELRRILETPDDQMLFDGGNYDPETNRFCPLAVALGIDRCFWVQRPSNAMVDIVIGIDGRTNHGKKFIYNQMHGTPGDFYRDDRPGDLRRVIADILESRS